MVLFFVSPIGLGHASRSIAIMDKLNIDKKNSLFVSGSSACRLIKDGGFNVLDRYNPPKFDVKDGVLENSFVWLLRYFSYYKQCKKISNDVINNYNNHDLIISDEDFASLVVAEKLKKKRILITDITNTSFTRGFLSYIERKMNKQMEKIIKSCDCVIIPDFGDDKDNIRYVGPIVRETTKSREDLREEFGFDKKTIVASIGGTDLGRHLLEKTIATWRKIKKSRDLDLVVISGPSLQMHSSSPVDFRNLGYVNNLHEYIYAADLVVSLAGRSTMDEAIVYGTPGIFIPIKDHFEQEQGAKRLGYEHKDILRLEELILKIINSDFKRNNFEFSKSSSNNGKLGVSKAANIISKFL